MGLAHVKPKKHFSLVILGLDNSGKTTLVNKIKSKQRNPLSSAPTVSFNIDTVQFKNKNITVWDVGGKMITRDLWVHYLNIMDGLVYMIDDSDPNRLEESCKEFEKLKYQAEIFKKPILIFVNKNDLQLYSLQDKIIKKFDLNNMNNPFKIQSCSAYTGKGVYEGLEWLINSV